MIKSCHGNELIILPTIEQMHKIGS